MTQRTTNTLCLLLAVAGLSFGIGQTVGQDRAQADAQTSRVLIVKDKEARKWLRAIGFYTLETSVSAERGFEKTNRLLRAVCLNVRLLNTATPGTGSSEFVCPPL